MKKYLITAPELYKDFIAELNEQIGLHKPDYILYRDKENPEYKTQAVAFIKLCSNFKSLKSFLHQDIDLAKELNATGVHLTSQQFDKIQYAKSLGLEVIISTHSQKELTEAQNLGADAVTFSPIFETPNKGEPKGISQLKETLDNCEVNVFALGGITQEWQIEEVKEAGAYGFASIRYFSSPAK